MVSIESLMYQSAEEVLATIGEPARKSLLRQLEQDGIEFSAKKTDLVAMESTLRQFFGIGSPVIIEKIYNLFIAKAIESGYISPDASTMLDVDSSSIIRHCNKRQARKST